MQIDQPEGQPDEQIAWGSDVAAAMLRRFGLPYISLCPGASFRDLHDSNVNHLGGSEPSSEPRLGAAGTGVAADAIGREPTIRNGSGQAMGHAMSSGVRAMASPLVAVALGAVAAGPAAAQDGVAELYRGRTMTIVVGASAGGGMDLFARQLSRYLGKHIPGGPQVVVTNIPGAGSKVAARNVYAVAAKDGTVMGTVLPGALMEPIRVEAAKRDYDPLRFNYIGNGNAEALTTVLRTDAGIASIDDMFGKEVIAGTPGGGSSVHESTMVARNILGLKLKVVTGYPGVREIGLAMEKGEVQGMVGLAFTTVRQYFPDYLTGAKGFRVIAQDNPTGHPELNRAGVPRSIDKARTAADRAALELYQSQAVLVRVYVMPPGVPAQRVAAVRKAFMDTINSAEFQAEITKSRSDAVPQSGEEIQALIARMYASPPELVARVAAATQN